MEEDLQALASLIVVPFAKIEKNEMGLACSAYGE
jgi:hypothetical protein